MRCLLSEISEINMPNVIHVMGGSGISNKNSTGAQVNVLKKKCRTSGASGECAQINGLLIVQVSEINIPHVIHVLAVSRISEKNSPGVQANVLEKCAMFGASARCEQIN